MNNLPLKAVPLDKLIGNWLSDLRPNSRRNYAHALKRFTSWRGADITQDNAKAALFTATSNHIRAYFEWLRLQPGKPERGSKVPLPLSNNTIRNEHKALLSFYAFTFAQGIINHNPVARANLNLPSANKFTSQRVEALTDSEVMKIFQGAEEISGDMGKMDRGFLAVLFGTGARVSEICHLRLIDCKVTESGLMTLRYTTTKTDRERTVPLASWARDYLDKWLEIRKREALDSYERIFPFTRTSGYLKVRYYAKRAGVKHASPHSARATVVTKLLKEGKEYHEIQAVTGHASITSVVGYDRRRIEIDENPSKDLAYWKKS